MQMLRNSKREPLYTPAMLMLILIVGISFSGLGFVAPLRALYGRELGATSIEIALLTSSFLLAGFLASPMIGWLADRFGYRRILWVGLVAHTLLMLAYIPVQNPLLLLVLRALEGIASVSVLPPARALVNVAVPRTRQGEALGVLSASQAGGILLGPVIGTLLASRVGYAPSFLIASALLALSVIAVIFLPRDSQLKSTTAALESPVAFAGLFTRQLLLAYLLQLIVQTTQGVISALWSLYMLDRGASLPAIGLSFTTFALPLIFLTPLSGRFSDRHGRYWQIVVGLLLFGIVFCLYGQPLSVLWLLIISMIEGTAAAVMRGALDGLLADVAPGSAKGKVQANFSASGTLGSFIGATFAGVLYAFAPGAPFVSAGILCLATFAALFLPGIVRLFPGRSAASSDEVVAVDEVKKIL